ARVDTVAMEATGVYWVPLYDLLEAEGFRVLLVDPHQTRAAPGRPKTDVKDCMWIQRLHSLGLLSAAFRPEEPIRVLRSYQRHRASLVEDASRFILRMQKALEQMNVKLTEVLADVTGVTGMAILRAILAGERDPARKRRGNEPHFDARQRLYEMAGVDLTAIEGVEAGTALVVLSEVGTDMSRWRSEKAFGAWLGLAPNPRKSGRKVKSAATRAG